MLSAVVVVYKTPAELAAAVASLHAQSQEPDEVVIVDNGAADGAPLPAWQSFDAAKVVRPPTNVGFGAGCNIGVQAAATDNHLLVMNADVVLSSAAVESMLRRLASDDRIGVVGPRILSGGELQLSARSFPGFRTGLLGRRSILTRVLIRARRYPAEFRHTYGGGGRVDWVSGACMLVRRSAFDAVGGFDESYFMYWEDADLCRRLGDAGWTVQYEPAAVVHHATGASGTSERTITAFHQSAAHFATRHIAHTPAQRAAFRTLLKLRCWAAVRTFRRARRVS